METRPHFRSVEKGHGSLETLDGRRIGEGEGFAPRRLWKGLGSLADVRFQREDLLTGKGGGEWRCFFSSPGSAEAKDERMAGYVRGHWDVAKGL